MDRSISLCMIARDEEAMIGQAISSVKHVVEQIIVVDTGSEDRTKETAAQAGAEVVSVPWRDDFSAARNVGLDRASGAWVLVLDADEAIAPEQLAILTAHTTSSDTCFELTQRHYANDHRLTGFEIVREEYPQWERTYRGYFESSLVRLFPNKRGIRYVGRIHELVEPSIASLGGLKIERSPIKLHHYGHTPEVLERKNKNRLYKSLGAVKLVESPDDWKAFYEFGVECNRSDQREQSVTAFERSIELNPNYLPTWVNLGYVLCELGRCVEAVECLGSALALDPKSAEAHCNMGVALLRLGQFERAESHFREAVKLNQRYLNAYLNLSRALCRQRRLPEAILAAERALELAPKNPVAVVEIAGLYALGGAPSVALSLLKTVLQSDPALPEARNLYEALLRENYPGV